MARERQTTPIVAPTAASAELGIALEDAGGLSALGPQKQAPIRFDSSSTLQGFDTIMSLARLGLFGAQWRNFALTLLLASLGNSDAKADSPSQSLAAAVDALVAVNEDQFRASLTDEDRQRLIAATDKLRDIIGTERKHFLIPLIDFIDNLIENREEEPGMETRKLRRPRRSRRTEGRPRFKLADLLDQEAVNAADNQTLNTTLKPRRPEKVGRPNAVRRRVELPNETDDDAYGEVDTGGPVGYEAW